jgi:tetratricopeptide (TPR) repeat protein
MAYLDQSQVPAALEVVDSAMKSLPEDPDLLCLRGRCLQAKGDYDRAGDAFQQAYDLGCRKRELFVGWNAVAEDHEDWKAMIEVSRLADAHVATSRSILSRNFARAQLGHERCRGGDYKGAIDFYESALGELRSAINTFHNSGDRAEFSKQRELLAVSWLGAIQQSAIQAGDDGRRVFGAYHRAIVTFRLQSPHTFMSAIGVLADWVKRVQQRQLVSATARDNLVLAKGRLSTLQEVVDANKRFSENFAAQFHSAAGQLHSEISRLVT